MSRPSAFLHTFPPSFFFSSRPPDSDRTGHKQTGDPCPHPDESSMNLAELKRKTPAELLAFAEELQIENASSLRKRRLMFAILKQLAENDVPISGDGTLEMLVDGFGFLRSPEANYLPGPDDIYVSPNQVPPLRPAHWRYGRGPDSLTARRRTLFRDGQGGADQFRRARPAAPPDQFRQSDPALPRRKIQLELDDGRPREDMTTRVIDLIAPLGKGQAARLSCRRRAPAKP